MEEKFTYLKIKPFILFISVSFLLSCSGGRIWDYTKEEILANCRRGDYSFLDNISFTRHNPADIRKLKPGAPYFFFRIFKQRGEDALATRVLANSLSRAPAPWQGFYVETLAAHYLEHQNYREAADLVSDYLKKHPASPHLTTLQEFHIEAVYWQEEDEAVLDLLHRYFPGQRKGECLLFELVSLYRLGHPAWEDALIRLCTAEPASLLHARFYRFMEIRGELSSLDPWLGELLLAKYHLANGRLQAATGLLKEFFGSGNAAAYDRSRLVRDLGHAWLITGKYREGATFLADLAPTLKETEKLTAWEMAARLYHKTGYYTRARPLLEQVFTTSTDAEQQDRTLWFYLDTYLDKLSPGDFLAKVYPLSKQWHDPGYFADHMHKTLSYLVAEKDWRNLQEFNNRLWEVLSPDTRQRLTYIMARATDLGYVPAGGTRRLQPGGLTYKRGLDYYSFLDAYRQGHLPAFFTMPQKEEKKIDSGDKLQELLARGYFTFGLVEQGIEHVTSNYRKLSKDSILVATRQLLAKEDYLDAISLMKRMVLTGDFPLLPEDLFALFPTPYADLIQSLSREEELPPSLIYGLVYVESAFDPLIGSDAGAKGLTQLMEVTANDMAKLLRISNPNLLDPETNLRLGSHYLSRLYYHLDDLPGALMAYNAGLTRFRRWEDTPAAGLPADLMIEALPYEETRNYLVDVIEATIMYGYLYADTDPAETIRLFFPDYK